MPTPDEKNRGEIHHRNFLSKGELTNLLTLLGFKVVLTDEQLIDSYGTGKYVASLIFVAQKISDPFTNQKQL